MCCSVVPESVYASSAILEHLAARSLEAQEDTAGDSLSQNENSGELRGHCLKS
jgi:hypothetical protein